MSRIAQRATARVQKLQLILSRRLQSGRVKSPEQAARVPLASRDLPPRDEKHRRRGLRTSERGLDEKSLVVDRRQKVSDLPGVPGSVLRGFSVVSRRYQRRQGCRSDQKVATGLHGVV